MQNIISDFYVCQFIAIIYYTNKYLCLSINIAKKDSAFITFMNILSEMESKNK